MKIQIAQFVPDRNLKSTDLSFIIISNNLYKVRWGNYPNVKDIEEKESVITNFRYKNESLVSVPEVTENFAREYHGLRFGGIEDETN